MPRTNIVVMGRTLQFRLFALVAVFLPFSAHGEERGDHAIAPVNREAGEFTLALLPDTQRYTWMDPEIFYAQTRWIARQRDPLDIRFVIHLGDIVDDYTDAEWKVADRAMATLDGVVPYSVTPGNHDLGRNAEGSVIRNSSKYNAVFPPHRFRDFSWYGGHRGVTNENNYCLFEAGGEKYLVLSLEFGPPDATLDWANDLIPQFQDHRVILATHCYMYHDDTRMGEGDDYSPHKKGPAWNDGEEIWEKCVRRHPNIFMVVSGHVKGDGAGRLISRGDAGNAVYQMLSNYQMVENGGNGWLRILRFLPREKIIQVTTYSPTLDRIDNRPDQTFLIDEKQEVFR
jgi:hypothetical protein